MSKKEMLEQLTISVARLDTRMNVIEEDVSQILRLLKEVYSCWDHWDDGEQKSESHPDQQLPMV